MVTTHPFPVLRVAPRTCPTIFRPSRQALAVLALVGANVIWGGSVVASKVALAHPPPLTLAGFRVAVALVVLELILRRTGARAARGRGPGLLGLTGVALFCTCQNLGLRAADAATAALIGGAIPVLTALLAVPLLGERLSGRRLGGLLISLVGVAAVVLLGWDASLGTATLANLLPLVSAAGFAAYAVLGRRIFGSGGDALAIVTGSTRYGLHFLLPGMLVELMTSEVGTIDVRNGLLVLYLGVGCSALAFVLYGYGLAHLAAGQGAVFGDLKTLVGVFLAMALLREPITAGQLGGGVLVLLGVGLASGRRHASRCDATARATNLRRMRFTHSPGAAGTGARPPPAPPRPAPPRPGRRWSGPA